MIQFILHLLYEYGILTLTMMSLCTWLLLARNHWFLTRHRLTILLATLINLTLFYTVEDRPDLWLAMLITQHGLWRALRIIRGKEGSRQTSLSRRGCLKTTYLGSDVK